MLLLSLWLLICWCWSRLHGLQVSGGTDPPFHLEAVLNPLSRPAQRLSALLLVLREALGPSMSLILNPQQEVTEMPLKSYYKYGRAGNTLYNSSAES